VEYSAREQSAVSPAMLQSAIRLLLRSPLAHETHRLPSETKAERDGLLRWLQPSQEQLERPPPQSSFSARATCGICLLSLDEKDRARQGKEEKSDGAAVHELSCCGQRCHLLCLDGLLSRHSTQQTCTRCKTTMVRAEALWTQTKAETAKQHRKLLLI
jgi:hypothetical protein